MSVTTRIRLVGAFASSFAMAVAVFVVSGVWASTDALPGMVAVGSASALMGMLLTTTIGVALTLSPASSGRRSTLSAETTQPLQPQTSYRFPPA
jgi:hypothetical protein